MNAWDVAPIAYVAKLAVTDPQAIPMFTVVVGGWNIVQTPREEAAKDTARIINETHALAQLMALKAFVEHVKERAQAGGVKDL